ncbi:MAG TPA: L-histidine N(alpha)-methyltransferase [Nocardioidaceae bacterium]|nr:L-histidine N(alpha)-methyltransferase [Nocardioidaceae bacterium]
MSTTNAVEVRLSPNDLNATLRADVRRGLTATPKVLPPKYFYDARGSELFEEITRLPEYYPTGTERGLLSTHAADIARLTSARTLVELGSGSSEKTRLLLHALSESLACYVPIDVSESALAAAVSALGDEFPDLAVRGVVADFEDLSQLPGGHPRLTAFLGGTIGNLDPAERVRFLAGVAQEMVPGDALLLGTDLVKDPTRLVSAYDDAAGVTAAFNLNVLSVMNRQLGADFDPAGFTHVALWDAEREWIEMRLRSLRDQRVHVRDLDLEVSFDRGEEMRTEISAKFRRDRVAAELSAAGLSLSQWWTDPDGDFALSLATPA